MAVLTGVPLLGLAEMLAHFYIDYGKCRLRYSLALDQALHLLCKVVWLMMLLIAI